MGGRGSGGRGEAKRAAAHPVGQFQGVIVQQAGQATPLLVGMNAQPFQPPLAGAEAAQFTKSDQRFPVVDHRKLAHLIGQPLLKAVPGVIFATPD